MYMCCEKVPLIYIVVFISFFAPALGLKEIILQYVIPLFHIFMQNKMG